MASGRRGVTTCPGGGRFALRALVAPLVRYVDALRSQRAGLTVTVVLPELIVKRLWHRPLHSGSARRLRHALRRQRVVVIATVAHHLAI